MPNTVISFKLQHPEQQMAYLRDVLRASGHVTEVIRIRFAKS